MAYEQNIHPVAVPASADLSANQFYVMDINSSGQLVTQTTSGGIAVGILQDKPNAAGVPGELQAPGPVVSKAAAGAAYNNGAELMCDTSGRLITATTGGHYVLARALEAAGASGEIHPVLLVGPYYKA